MAYETFTSANINDFYGSVPSAYWENYYRATQQAAMQQRAFDANYGISGIPYVPSPALSSENTLVLIKKSIKEIKAEAVSEEAQKSVRGKIERLQKLGVTAQATVLELELQVRIKLARVQEWDYKVLPYDAIKEFESANRNWDGKGGRYLVHVDPLEKYCGTLVETEAKDKIIPDNVLDELEKAYSRQVFDQVSVLWVEKVKDPLLLGLINGCKDFFLICEWGEDISFDQIMKGK